MLAVCDASWAEQVALSALGRDLQPSTDLSAWCFTASVPPAALGSATQSAWAWQERADRRNSSDTQIVPEIGWLTSFWMFQQIVEAQDSIMVTCFKDALTC